jgi:hypothetical protein
MTAAALIRVTGSLAAITLAYGAYRIAQFIYAELTSPLRDLPGPKSPSLIYGHFKEIFDAVGGIVFYLLTCGVDIKTGKFSSS